MERLLQQLQRLVEGIAAVFTKHAGEVGFGLRRFLWLHCCMASQHLNVPHTACGQANETRRAVSAGAVPHNRRDPVHHATLGGLCGQHGASS